MQVREQTPPYLEETTITAYPLQDAAHGGISDENWIGLDRIYDTNTEHQH